MAFGGDRLTKQTHRDRVSTSALQGRFEAKYESEARDQIKEGLKLLQSRGTLKILNEREFIEIHNFSPAERSDLQKLRHGLATLDLLSTAGHTTMNVRDNMARITKEEFDAACEHYKIEPVEAAPEPSAPAAVKPKSKTPRKRS